MCTANNTEDQQHVKTDLYHALKKKLPEKLLINLIVLLSHLMHSPALYASY
jgi:hypothetical protein